MVRKSGLCIRDGCQCCTEKTCGIIAEGGMEGTGAYAELHGKSTGAAETGKHKRGNSQREGI